MIAHILEREERSGTYEVEEKGRSMNEGVRSVSEGYGSAD
jgi:hypothetical protein